MKKFEKLAVVLIILWGLQVLLSALTPFWIRQIVESENASSSLEAGRMIALSTSMLIQSLSAVACGIWLYLEAKKEGSS